MVTGRDARTYTADARDDDSSRSPVWLIRAVPPVLPGLGVGDAKMMMKADAQDDRLRVPHEVPPLADTDIDTGILARLRTVVSSRPNAGAVTAAGQTLT